MRGGSTEHEVHAAGAVAARVRWRAFERNPRLGAVRDRLLLDVAAPFSLGHAAAIAGVSSKHFSAWFRAKVGAGFLDWVHEVRARAAEPLVVGTERPLADVARCCGFGSLRTFERAFKRRFGTSARCYRKAWRREPGNPCGN